MAEDKDPLLLTPGPLTTSMRVKEAMLRDLGSRDDEFIKLNEDICTQLLKLIKGGEDFCCVPLQGSGTFSVEAMLGTLIPRKGKVLNLVNGAYGHRITEICSYLQRDCKVMEWEETVPVDTGQLDKALEDDTDITHVVMIHCETTSGILNPLAEISDVVKKHGKSLLIDAMSSFGAINIDAAAMTFDAVVASSNKCLQGTPGMGFTLVRKSALEECEGNAHSLALDLFRQSHLMVKIGQWRFTPPVHCMLSLAEALRELDEEGGVAARGQRYGNNCRVLREGMRELGFETLLSDELQAPIIVTFLKPDNKNFVFQEFYDRLHKKGFIIYPGKITKADTFRMGCIGDLDEKNIQEALKAIKSTLAEMGM